MPVSLKKKTNFNPTPPKTKGYFFFARNKECTLAVIYIKCVRGRQGRISLHMRFCTRASARLNNIFYIYI